jgi:hypothetical protein
MAIVLGDNRYGKAENRLVRVDRDGDEHRITDLNVSVSLSGDMSDTHLTGANDKVLATDTQKNTVHAFAREGIGEIEDYALRLSRHFAGEHPHGARRGRVVPVAAAAGRRPARAPLVRPLRRRHPRDHRDLRRRARLGAGRRT